MTNEFLKNELQEIMNGLKNLQSAFILLQEDTEKIKTLIKDQRYDLLTAHAVKTKDLYDQLKHIELKYNAIKRLVNEDFEEDKKEIETLINWFR
jgi:phosphoribosylanthranilate isomerase